MSDNRNPILRVFLVIAVVGAVAMGTIWTVNLRTVRATAEQASTSSNRTLQEGSPLVKFTPDDVIVTKGWTLLSGHHPTTVFQCQPSPTLRRPLLAFLCYRTAGAPDWEVVETRPGFKRTCTVTLRDLHHDMPYECYFIVQSKDTIVRSATVRFRTL
jgi:hypothetical protein